MLVKAIVFILLAPLLVKADNIILSCPYQTEVASLANSLAYCLNNPNASVGIRCLFESFHELTYEVEKPLTSSLFYELTKYIYIKTDEHKICSDNFNSLLSLIIKSRPNLILNTNNNARAKIKKLVEDSITYQNYYCDNLESERIEEYEKK